MKESSIQSSSSSHTHLPQSSSSRRHPPQQQPLPSSTSSSAAAAAAAAAAAIALKFLLKHVTNKNKTKHIMKISHINIIYDKTATSQQNSN
jgi:hypothetical protein